MWRGHSCPRLSYFFQKSAGEDARVNTAAKAARIVTLFGTAKAVLSNRN